MLLTVVIPLDCGTILLRKILQMLQKEREEKGEGNEETHFQKL